MNILVTGAKGFMGKNLISELRNRKYSHIFEYDIDTDPALLDSYCGEAGFIFHLAGVNRPKEQAEFMEGNVGFTAQLLDTLKKHHNTCPVMLASSIQAALDNPYGKSKKAGEELLFSYGRETGARVLVYRFPNVFGKWCRPNYNSAVATFCHNIAAGQPITLHERSTVLQLVYIDDVVEELIKASRGVETREGAYCTVPVTHTVTLGEIADLLYSFRSSRSDLSIADMSDPFTKKLYSTYLSYLPKDQFSYPLKMNMDDRGSFTEFIRTPERGQISVNISKPGITKGSHWHHTKVEKFLVVSGYGVIRLRQVHSGDVVEYKVSGEKLDVVDIPAGYAHSIQNLGETDMVTMMWTNELFNPQKQDTYYLEV